MILEGICTTLDVTGELNIAPMGPVVDPALSQFLFRPYAASTTFRNLQQTRCGIFHVTDDVLLIARLVTGSLAESPSTFSAVNVPGQVLADTCRWYEFEVLRIDDSRERTEIHTRIVHVGRMRDFWGFNRAKHAVLEAAILITRLHLLPREYIAAQLRQLQVPVEKTASPAETEAFALLLSHARAYWGGAGDCGLPAEARTAPSHDSTTAESNQPL